MSTKRKIPLFAVGMFLLTGLSVLGWMIVKYGGTSKVQEGYTINVEFDDASGIIEGGIVRIAGANAGYIAGVPTLTEDHKIVVPLTIREDLELPSNTRFEIVSLSLLGDKAVYIKIPKDAEQTYLSSGDYVKGVSPKGLGDVQDKTEALLEKTNLAIEEYSGVAEKLNVSLDRLNNSLLEQSKLDDMSTAVLNIKEASQSFKELTNGLHPLADEARLTMAEFRKAATGANSTIAEFKKTAQGANSTMVGVSETLAATEDTVIEAKETFAKVNSRIEKLDPTLAALPETLKTYDRVGKNLEKSLTSEDSLLGTITGDKEVKDDAKTFVKNLRTNGILGYKDDSDPDKDDPRDRYRGMRR